MAAMPAAAAAASLIPMCGSVGMMPAGAAAGTGEGALTGFLSGAMGASYGANAAQVLVATAQQLAHKKSSSVPTGVLPAVGFAQFEGKLFVDRNWYMDWATAKDAMIESIEGHISHLSPTDAERAKKALKELRRGAVQKDCYGVHIPYKNKQGQWNAYYAVMCPSTLSNGMPAFLFGWAELEVKATKAVEYLMITHSKSSFLSDKTWHEIVPLPSDNKGISAADTEALLGILGPVAQMRFQDLMRPSTAAAS